TIGANACILECRHGRLFRNLESLFESMAGNGDLVRAELNDFLMRTSRQDCYQAKECDAQYLRLPMKTSHDAVPFFLFWSAATGRRFGPWRLVATPRQINSTSDRRDKSRPT